MFCGVGIIGILASLGLFEARFSWDFYEYFTNISNYLCIGIMFAELVQTAKRKSNGYVSTATRLKFVAMMGIMLTFFVFNFLLADKSGNDVFKVGSIIMHISLPIAFTIDWLLFYEHGKTKITNAFLSMIFPLSYVGFVYLHAFLRGFNSHILNSHGTGPLIFPYFFLNYKEVGITGVVQWVIILTLCFAALAFIFISIDRLLKNRKFD